ncbi:MAG TPA: hypothetical protein PKU97_06885, partial [Kofleriaceae bacterium]|nr:hypothetical protein [Kofleriaceae bacterium]
MAARFLDDAARAAFKEAIEALETASSIEVVVALRRQSSGNLLPNLVVGCAAAFFALAYMLYAKHQFSLLAILIDPFVLGLGLGLVVELVAPLKRRLSPRGRRRFAVERGAKAAFYDRGVANTRARTGVLIYLSWMEQDAVVLADSGVPAAWRDGARGELERKLAAAMPHGGARVAEV